MRNFVAYFIEIPFGPPNNFANFINKSKTKRTLIILGF